MVFTKLNRWLLWAFSLAPVIILCSSCQSGKWLTRATLMRNQQLYSREGNPASTTLYLYQNNNPLFITVREDGDALFINDIDEHTHPIRQGTGITPPSAYGISESRLVSPPSYYFSLKEGRYQHASTRNALAYRHTRLYLQALAVPIKFRRAAENMKSQAETGPTFALAPGFKHSWSWYNGSKNALGQTTTSVSISAGGLAGLGVVDVTDKTTNNRVAAADASKNTIVPLGFHLMLGIAPINVGIAVGCDVITGRNKKEWIYRGERWTGIIVGLDLIK